MKLESYQQEVDDIIYQLRTNKVEGLSKKEAALRLQREGYNALPEKPQESIVTVFFRQFQNPLIYILLIAAVLIFFVGSDALDAFIILGVLFFNAIIGTVQEGRTRSILKGLQKFIVANSVVLRDGEKKLIVNQELVNGDIILLQEGARVPADARIVISNQLQVDEAVLTGESKPVRKSLEKINKHVSLGDRINMLYKGTYVMSGSGHAVVVATGQKTEIGKIHADVTEFQTDMPLKKELDLLSYWILIFILGMCGFLFAIGFMLGKPLQELLVMLTALFICVIPEGLPVVLTLVLVTGVYKMAKHNVLVKKMQAVEGLGRTDVIVVDKTGTLTRNEMMVAQAYADNQHLTVTGRGYHKQGELHNNGKDISDITQNEQLKQMAVASYLLNSAEITHLPEINLFDIKGDPTEAALYIFAHKSGLPLGQITQRYKKVYEIPFDPQHRLHTGFYEHNSRGIVFIAGSPEALLKRCSNIADATRSALDSMLSDGLRVVALATSTFDLQVISKQTTIEQAGQLIGSQLQLLGLCGIQDAIRSEVAQSVNKARKAGLRVIMATGDHKQTALYVAKRVGLYQEGDIVIEGMQLDQMTDKELVAKLPKITVFARVSPEHKLRIIKLLRQTKKTVAMTGDGINDAPSLVAADLGIAMGSIGTEVAKQASDIILLDDSFSNIIAAIEQGRHIFYSLKRVVLYFFATNMGEILIVLFALCMNLPLPITAAQILWLNLVTDGFLDVALAMEPKEEGLLLQRWWLKGNMRLVDWRLLGKMMYMALPMAIGSIVIFYWYHTIDLVYARTMTLVAMAMFQWFNAWNCRSDTKSFFSIGLFTNRWLIGATGLVLGLQFLLLHTSFLQGIFKTVPLAFNDWVIIIVVSFPIIIVEEARKWVVRRWFA